MNSGSDNRLQSKKLIRKTARIGPNTKSPNPISDGARNAKAVHPSRTLLNWRRGAGRRTLCSARAPTVVALLISIAGNNRFEFLLSILHALLWGHFASHNLPDMPQDRRFKIREISGSRYERRIILVYGIVENLRVLW